MLALPDAVQAALRAQLPGTAAVVVAAVTDEVGEYSAVEPEVGDNIRQAVQLALGTFLRLAAAGEGDVDALQPAVQGAYALGRGEARSGRTADALLTAYRVGARVAWREMSATAVESGLPAGAVARFAELVFAYIEELSGASVAGHGDELARTGRAREQALARLAAALLSGAGTDELAVRAERAEWPPPETLTAVVLPAAQLRGTLPLLDPRTLGVAGDQVGVEDDTAVLLVPDAGSRAALLRALAGRAAVVGPVRPWTAVRASFLRARRLAALRPVDSDPVDTEQHLPELVLRADADALADLRAAVLAPLAGVRTADRLAETLAAWLLHQGRREDVARALHVHPQTVRYRMTQVRELFGDRLTDPAEVLALTVALGLDGTGV